MLLLASGVCAWPISNPLLEAADSAPTRQYFAETGHLVSNEFLAYWHEHGALAQFGYPISEEYFEGYGKVQYFERAKFELHPELTGTPFGVELALLGSQTLDRQGRQFAPVDPSASSSSSSPAYFKETGHTLGGSFLTYWQQHGGLPIFGFPLSQEIQEVSPTDGQSYTVQYFERNRFELHPALANSPFEVELGLLGSEAYRLLGPPKPTATWTVDAGAPIATPGPLVGVSFETSHYALPNDPLHPDWNGPNQTTALKLSSSLATGGVQPLALRFGGSSIDGGRLPGLRAGGADGYHWKEAFRADFGQMNLDEIAVLGRQLQADLTMQVNFGSSRAEEAAAEVAYTNGTDPNDPNVALRRVHGYSEPFNIGRWEIGGELYV